MGLFSNKPSENAQKIIDFPGCDFEYFPVRDKSAAVGLAWSITHSAAILSIRVCRPYRFWRIS